MALPRRSSKPPWPLAPEAEACDVAEAPRTGDYFEGFGRGRPHDEWDQNALRPNALRKLLQFAFFEGPARVGGGLPQLIDGESPEVGC